MPHRGLQKQESMGHTFHALFFCTGTIQRCDLSRLRAEGNALAVFAHVMIIHREVLKLYR